MNNFYNFDSIYLFKKINLRPKCSCINPKSNKEWTSGETLFGELKGGV